MPNADLAVVKLADGGDFSRGAGKERFISDVELIAGELLFFHGVAEVSGKLHDGIAREAAQNGRPGRGFDHAVAHDKDVLARGFGNIAVGVEHHGFVIAVFLGFHLGKDGVDVVAGGLGLGHAGIHMAAGKAAGLDADALFKRFCTKVCAPSPSGNNGLHRVVAGVDAHFAVAHKGERTHVTFAQFVGLEGFNTGGYQLVSRKGYFHAHNLSGVN